MEIRKQLNLTKCTLKWVGNALRGVLPTGHWPQLSGKTQMKFN